MKQLSSVLLTVLLAAPATVCSAGPSGDEAEIRSLVSKRQADAWNRHDAKAYAALFTEDADVVNVVGWWWRGRSEIERKLTAAFTFVFRDSALAFDRPAVRFLASDIAVVHETWTMTGAKMPPGMPEPKMGLQTMVLRKHSGTWLISVFQNTNSVPERPFPLGPPVMVPATPAP
ncbi:SgcJ/EcaC family oxidoreductase [Vulcanimicrobium alpinum]|uniref:SgcJ/EcaC family oxidoreductase n=1 Tax=Vulcanimicrobium alpinum TaxID=3016050 RepID=UPI00295E34B4|nr:SgcJ/EcaC family oxidoreductase [Vulcanimicrobium alpinum]